MNLGHLLPDCDFSCSSQMRTVFEGPVHTTSWPTSPGLLNFVVLRVPAPGVPAFGILVARLEANQPPVGGCCVNISVRQSGLERPRRLHCVGKSHAAIALAHRNEIAGRTGEVEVVAPHCRRGKHRPTRPQPYSRPQHHRPPSSSPGQGRRRTRPRCPRLLPLPRRAPHHLPFRLGGNPLCSGPTSLCRVPHLSWHRRGLVPQRCLCPLALCAFRKVVLLTRPARWSLRWSSPRPPSRQPHSARTMCRQRS